MIDIVFIITISISVILIVWGVILLNNYLYNAVYNRKERNLWKFVIRNADKFDYISTHKLGKMFRWGDYLAIVWNDNTCSIHIDTPTRRKCLGTNFDKVMSNKMRDLLLTKIK